MTPIIDSLYRLVCAFLSNDVVLSPSPLYLTPLHPLGTYFLGLVYSQAHTQVGPVSVLCIFCLRCSCPAPHMDYHIIVFPLLIPSSLLPAPWGSCVSFWCPSQCIFAFCWVTPPVPHSCTMQALLCQGRQRFCWQSCL